MVTGAKVLKISVAPKPVLLKAKETLKREAGQRAEEIVADAHATAAEVRKEATELAAAEKSRAETEAARVIREAEENRDALIHEASDKARAQAKQEVLDEFRPRIEAATELFERTVREAENVWRNEFDRHKDAIVEIVLAIAEKIVKKVSDEDRELVRRTAEAALSRAVDRQNATLRVNPDDLAILEEYRIELLNRFEDLQTFKIEEDRRVDRGGVWIETASGFIDARIRSQMEEIFESVLPGVERREPPPSAPETGEDPPTPQDPPTTE